MYIFVVVIILFCFGIGSAISIIYRKQMQFWLPGYLIWRMQNNGVKEMRLWSSDFSRKTIHILLCIADHFEPGTAEVPAKERERNPGVSSEIERERVSQWVEKYPILAAKHRDADGKPPQHTWFFPPHYHRQDHLKRLVQLCMDGYGDIEMHLHHHHSPPDSETSESLRETLLKCIDDYSKYGIFVPSGNGAIYRRYAFIHGDWALDNSRWEALCGVNDELIILKETGCYADFTFPSINESQPRKINSIYYAADDPAKPKSYNKGTDVRVGAQPSGDLMMIQGPLGLRWKKRWRLPYPAIEYGELTSMNPPAKERVDFWVKTGIHVKGRPDWIIIKLHTHGAPAENREILLGAAMDDMYRYLETKYNNGQSYKLHYCTAREVYNIIKAAEAGEEGDPNRYRDYLIPPYNYTSFALK